MRLLSIIVLLAWLWIPALGQTKQKFPEVKFYDLKGEPFTTQKLEKGKPVIALFFGPYCEHCEKQAQWIQEAEFRVKDIQFLWVTTEPEVAPTQTFIQKQFADTKIKANYF